MRAASPPRQIESKNEMIVISYHLLCREIGLSGEGGRLKAAQGDPCFLHTGYVGEAPWKLRNLLSRQQKNALLLRAFFLYQLVVFRFDGKEALRMAAYRAFFRCFYGFYGVAAVSAHPKFLFAFLEDLAVFDISQ